MATWHHLNGQLFMPASMLKSLEPHAREITIDDEDSRLRDRWGNKFTPEQAFWQRKGDEAFDSGIYRSVKQRGVVNPIRLERTRYGSVITDGYHRVAATHDIDPTKFLPITYSKEHTETDDSLPIHWMRDEERFRHQFED